MPDPNPAVLDFLLKRRSRPAKTLTGPAPDRATLETLLTAAARSPDHGKLEPWRFMVFQGASLKRLAEAAERHGTALGFDTDKITKGRSQFAQSQLCVAVIEVQKPSEKIPAIEQTYSAGAVCLALVNAALAAGWGANWLSGWVGHERAFVEAELGLAPHERVAGYIHLGTETSVPPERPRPDLVTITEWVEE